MGHNFKLFGSIMSPAEHFYYMCHILGTYLGNTDSCDRAKNSWKVFWN